MDKKLIDRFATKWALNKTSGCWEWTASLAGKGYGQIKLTGQRKQVYAHRVAYEIYKGPVPEGKCVLHRCDNPKCVNPEHLFAGSHQDNATDMKVKGRSTWGEHNAQAVLTPSDVKAIKILTSSGLLSQEKIAKMFGVQQMQISRIKRGIRWSHITD